MSSNSGDVGGIVPVHVRTHTASDAPEPGHGAKFDDGTWEVTGDGQMTETQAMQGIIHSEATHGDAQMQAVDGNEDFARQAAQNLWGGNPDEAIPQGTTKSVTLKDLVNLIAPFLDAYKAEQLRAQSGTSSSGSAFGGNFRTTTGQVYSQGFELPID